MLATLGDASDIDESEDDWAFEMKWDGIRAIATVANGAAHFVTRNGIDATVTYPELAEVGSLVDGEAVLDGEIVALDEAGRPDFGLLQQRMKLTKKSDVEPAARRVPVQYLIFDILESEGKDVTAETYDERRALLARRVQSSGHIHVPPAFEGDLAAAFESSRQLHLEGVMAKRRDSTYASGRRSRAWIKIKHHKTQEVIVAGWRPGNGRRENTVGSLLLGIPTPSGLRYVGRVGTGFSDRDLDELTGQLSRMSRKTSPLYDVPSADARDAHWVKPTLVGEVEFAEWTSADRLRQPSWRGWRTDKSPGDVVREG
jgi:bifunctional non-homologous end joining protein LigD